VGYSKGVVAGGVGEKNTTVSHSQVAQQPTILTKLLNHSSTPQQGQAQQTEHIWLFSN